MTLVLHDTASGEKKPFTPIRPERVTMYVCGPTVYDVPHIGNARPAVVFDVLFRVLRDLYGDTSVTYARNYTDIDDKIIARANERGIEIGDLTRETIEGYEAAMEALSVLSPTHKPTATGSLRSIIDLIQYMAVGIEVAYDAQGHILFDVNKAEGVTRLISGDVELKAGARVEVAPYKRDPRDFVLWKPAKEGEPAYEGPLGFKGRPGWHVECSAMIREVFSEDIYRDAPFTIDIHGGGQDLIFPHHQCEIMQSESVFKTPLANYWVHNGMLTVDGKKMSKSLGNFVTVPEALEKAPGEALRYLLLSSHYRQAVDFTWEKLAESKAALDRLYRALQKVWDVDEKLWPLAAVEDLDVVEALHDDLNTPEALAFLHVKASFILGQDYDDETRAMLKGDLLRAGSLLGILGMTPEEWFQGDKASDEIDALIAQREGHRQRREWAEADAVRKVLLDKGVVVEDTPTGPIWRAVD